MVVSVVGTGDYNEGFPLCDPGRRGEREEVVEWEGEEAAELAVVAAGG